MSAKEQLEVENQTLRELTAALVAMLAVIGEADPPLPADTGHMHKYDIECGRRLSAITTWAEPSTDMPGGLTAETVIRRTEHLRKSLARPLRYEPDAAATAAAVLLAPAPETNGSAS